MSSPAIGSIIRTSYGTGPYRLVAVRQHGKFCTLVMEGAAPQLRGRFIINGVYRDGDRWVRRLIGIEDEIYVEQDAMQPRQLELAVRA